MSDAQVKGIQRYDVVFRVDDEGEGYRKVKDVNGAYVLFKDHEQALAALEARNKELARPLSDEEKDALEDAIEIGAHRTWLVVEGILAARAALKGAS